MKREFLVENQWFIAFGLAIAPPRSVMKTLRSTLFVLAAALPIGATTPAVNTDEIIRKSVAVTREDWKQAPAYAFIERDLESKKDSRKTAKTYVVLMIDGSPYDKVIAIDDKPLSREQQQAEDQKLQNVIQTRKNESPRERRRRIAKYEKERSQDETMMREMVNAFNFHLLGETQMNGREVYQFQATPKPGYVPPNRDAKVLTGMRGMLWVDKETNQWVKVVAEVVHPVSFFGFIAKVGPGTRFELEQEPITATLWMPKHFSVNVNATAFGLFNENSTDDETYLHYQPMTRALELQAMR